MIKACDAQVSREPNFNVNYTAKMRIIAHDCSSTPVFSPGDIIGNFTIFEG